MNEPRTLYVIDRERLGELPGDYETEIRHALAARVLVPATVDDLPIVGEVALDILEVDEDGYNILQLAAHDAGIEPGVYALIPVAALGGTE